MKHPSPCHGTRQRTRLRPTLCLWLALALIPATSRAEVRIQDDLGREVRLPGPAKRIVALYGAFNEILAAMGLEDRIAARTEADQTPPSILERPVIGTHMRPNVELIVGLKPDLVLQMGGRKEASLPLMAIDGFKIPTALFEVNSVADLLQLIEKIGVLAGEEARARALAGTLRTRLSAVEQALKSDTAQPRVFFEVRQQNLLAAGRGSIASDVIRLAGGTNCLEEDRKIVPLGEEELHRLDPDVYVMQRGPMNPAPAPLTDRPASRTLRAVRQGLVFVVDEQAYSRPGPRNVDAVEELARLLHPAAFSHGPKE